MVVFGLNRKLTFASMIVKATFQPDFPKNPSLKRITLFFLSLFLLKKLLYDSGEKGAFLRTTCYRGFLFEKFTY
jgi:hypothetical protein